MPEAVGKKRQRLGDDGALGRRQRSDEAAVILEATPKAVESRLYRARQALREKLKSWM